MTSTSSPRTRRARRQRPEFSLSDIFVLVGGGISVGIISFWALSSTLTDMTWNDCQAGVQRACEELQK